MIENLTVFHLARKGSIDGVLQFLAHSPRAKILIDQFMQLKKSGKASIEKFDKKAQRMMKMTGPEILITHAGFLDSPKKKRIFIDLETELGFLALQLIHEMAHALDAEFSESYKESVRLLKRNRQLADQLLAKDKNSKFVQIRCKELMDEVHRFENQRVLRTEKKAYAEQFLVCQELIQAFPFYRLYLKRVEDEMCLNLLSPMTDVQIVQDYQLKTAA